MAFPRPPSERELVLIDVDPRRIHAFWTLPIGAVAAARAQPGGAGPDAPMVLRLSEIGDDGALGAFVDVEVVGLQAQSYVEVESACRRYRGELGLRRPDGVLVAIVASNDVVLPPTGPALPAEPEATKPEPIELAPVRVEPWEAAPVSVPFFTAPEPARPKHAMPVPPVGAAPGAPDHRQESLAPAADDAAGASDRATDQPSPLAALPLENVLALSSFALGRETVEFEINAELHVFGRVRPGTRLQLFGRPVTLRPDGTFSVIGRCRTARWCCRRCWSATIPSRRVGSRTAMARGYLALVLHAHLPFIRHPEYESFLEETWLFEAITDTYIPLLRVFEQLVADGVPFRLTLSLSPPLIAMLRDPFLQERYLAHLGKMEALGDKEILQPRQPGTPRGGADVPPAAVRDPGVLRGRCGGDLVGAFRRLQDRGVLEITTAAATHGYLPILKTAAVGGARPAAGRRRDLRQPSADGAGLLAARVRLLPGPRGDGRGDRRPLLLRRHPRHHQRRDAAALRLSRAARLRRRHGRLRPRSGHLAAGLERRRGLSRRSLVSRLLPRHRLRSRFRVHPAVHPRRHTRVFTGFKYHRITGRTDEKQAYEPAKARARADEHAADFLHREEQMVERCAPQMDRPPMIIALYDAELFGHWWFEGPQWLDYLIRKMVYDQKTVELVTPGDYLARHGSCSRRCRRRRAGATRATARSG